MAIECCYSSSQRASLPRERKQNDKGREFLRAKGEEKKKRWTHDTENQLCQNNFYLLSFWGPYNIVYMQLFFRFMLCNLFFNCSTPCCAIGLHDPFLYTVQQVSKGVWKVQRHHCQIACFVWPTLKGWSYARYNHKLCIKHRHSHRSGTCLFCDLSFWSLSFSIVAILVFGSQKRLYFGKQVECWVIRKSWGSLVSTPHL